ncbi:MAG TPA: type II toxin-antitoxin system RelE/ParE family toxin [Pirellulales bacterium]|nr:type II toxin-antitoxin system RelE/ParE family toxin [Pirellulales bacterium]
MRSTTSIGPQNTVGSRHIARHPTPNERRLRVRPQADADLDQQSDFIARQSPDSADRFCIAARETYQRLLETPELGSIVQVQLSGFHEIRVRSIPGFRNWLVFHRVAPEEIEVIRVLHAARKWEKLLGI